MTLADASETAPSFEELNWNKARKIFKDGRKEKDDEKKLDEFLRERASIQDAKEACEATKKAASAEYLPALGGILEKIDIAMSVGDLAIKSAPESIGLAWMGIRLCLRSVADDFSTFSIFGAACSDIVGILISCAVYGRMYGSPRGPESFQEIHSQVCDRIPNIYAEILDFSFSVKKYMGRKKLFRIGKGLLTQASAKYSGKIKSIKAHEATMSDFARKASDQLSDYYLRTGQENQHSMMGSLSELKVKMDLSLKVNQDYLEQLKVLTEERKTMRKKSLLEIALENFDANLKKLNATSDQKDVFASKIAKRSPAKTCTWIFEKDEYQNWRDSKQSNVLWVSGGGGFGKSILMSAVIQELQEQPLEHEPIVDYFFCNAGDDATKKTDRILKHVIFQLYQLVKDQPQETIEKANKFISSFLKKDSGTSKGGEGKKDEITFGAAYRGLAELLGKTIFVVFDALDECTDRQTEGLVSSIKDMANDPNLAVKVLVCSRAESDLASDLDGISRIMVEGNNGPDIKLNAETELSKLPGWTPLEREMACEKIVEKAGSYFRYVDLAVDFLKQPWRRPLKDHLEKLPKGLEAFYEQIISKTDPVYIELLKTCLTWTILSNGPIRVAEVVDVYSRTYMQAEDYALEDAPSTDQPPVPDQGEDLHVKQIRIAGSALLEVDSKSRVIQLRHNTVADYFLTEKPQSTNFSPEADHVCGCEYCQANNQAVDHFTLSEKHAHLLIATTILRHLSSDSFRRRYLVPFETHEIKGNYISNITESNAENEEDPKDADKNSATQSDEIPESSLPNPSVTEAPDAESEKNDNTRPLATVDGEADISEPLAASSSAKGGSAEASNEEEHPDTSPEQTLEAGSAADGSADAASDGGSDPDSDAGVDDQEGSYDYQDPPDPSERYRYEVNHFRHHLSRVEELWAEEDRQGTEWTEFEELRDAFFHDDFPGLRSWVNLRVQTRYSELYWVDDRLTVKPIHLAAAYGLTSLAAKLIEEKVDLSVTTDEGYTPLHFAAEYYGSLDGNKENGNKLLQLLLEAGADPNQLNKNSTYSSSPFSLLICQDPKIEAVRLFLEHGADATHLSKPWKRSILHDLAWRCDSVEVLHALIDAGADPNTKDNWGETPLHALMRRLDSSIEILDAMIARGADVNAEDDLSQMPLYEVAISGNSEAARVLIEHKADVMDDDTSGLTALHMACDSAHPKTAWLLIENGAQVSATDNRGRTPFYLACQTKNDETALSMIEKLDPKDHGVFTQASSAGKTPLHKAAARGHKSIVEALFEKLGHDVVHLNTQESKLRQTPLHAAAYNGRQSVVEYLLSNHAATDVRDKYGNTPLRCCFDGWTETKLEAYEAIALLLIDIDPKTAADDSELLNIAAIRGSLPVIRRLLDAGADPMLRDEHGWTPLQLARQYGRAEAAELLAKHRAVVGLQPTRFKNTLPKLLRVPEDGMEVEHLEAPSYPGVSLLSNHPIPAGTESYYYEIEVVAPDREEPPEVAFGLSQRVSRLKGWLPGWVSANREVKSWAYHGDDAGLWASQRGAYGVATLDKYGHGDVVGCGIDFNKKAMFYTRNGELILVKRVGQTPETSYYAYRKVDGRLHLVLGLRDKVVVRVNLGMDVEERPFKWEPANAEGFIEAVAKAEEEIPNILAVKPEDSKSQPSEEKEEKEGPLDSDGDGDTTAGAQASITVDLQVAAEVNGEVVAA